MAAANRKKGVEWVGGLVAMPAYVTGEGEPYRPELLLWMNAEGALVGTTTAKPGELLTTAGEHLRSTIERPMFGRAQTPARVRVASLELADALRASHPALDVVCAPTPEIDDAISSMREMMDERGDAEQTYLGPDIDEDAVASFFRAAAGLFRAKPWQVVPDDESLFSVTIESLDMRDAVMSVIGQMGQSHGLVFFRGIDDFEAYLDAAEAMENGEEPRMPPHFALNFERGAELSASLRKEVAKHRWELAGPNAYPWVVAVDADLVARPPTGKELTVVEAIARALPHVLGERDALAAAWNGGEPMTRTLTVQVHAGAIDVTLRAPYAQKPARPPFEAMAALFDLAKGGEEIDSERRRELEDELVEKFVASPEAKALANVQACHFVMDFGADYFGATIATLGPRELREILFEIIPRKVSTDASTARAIVQETRAFYTFLKREYALEQADACLRVLGGDAVKRLEDALSNSSNFGIAKSLFMAGREAGFDMDSKEGIEAWMRATQGNALPTSIRLPSFGAAAPHTADKAAARAKKNKRKAARNARRKNR
jgi:hypothetical protein